MLIVSLIFAQAALFGGEPLADPLAGITADWLLCSDPDDTAKTCRGLTTYSKTGDGKLAEVSQFGVAGLPGLVIEVPSYSYLKDGKLCGVAQLKDLDRLRIVHHVDKGTIQQETAALKRLQFLYPIEGKELCSAFYSDGEHFRVETSVNGQPVPEMTTRVRWVHKDDGYSVASWQGAITTALPVAR